MHSTRLLQAFTLVSLCLLVHRDALPRASPLTRQPSDTPQSEPESKSKSQEKTIKLMRLRCCFIISEPYVRKVEPPQGNQSAKTSYTGWSVDHLVGLYTKGLRCVKNTTYTSPNGIEQAHTAFTEMLSSCTNPDGTVQKSKDCQCDIGISAFLETPARTKVHFLTAYGFDDIAVITHKDWMKSSHSGTFFLAAFSYSLWLSILALLLVFTGLKLLDGRFAANPPKWKKHHFEQKNWWRKWKYFMLNYRHLYRLRLAFKSSIGQMVGFNAPPVAGEDRSTRMWFLNMVIAMSGMFIVLIYESSMTALLVGRESQSAFTSIKDFTDCHIPDDHVCFLRESAVAEFWDATIRVHHNNSKNCLHRDKQHKDAYRFPRRYDNMKEMTAAVLNKKCRYMIADGGAADVIRGEHCRTLAKAGPSFLPRDVHFVLPRNSPYIDVLNIATLKLRQEKDEPLQDYRDRVATNVRHDSCDVHDLYLSFTKLRLFFVFAFVSCLLVFLQMVIDPPRDGIGDQPTEQAVVSEVGGMDVCGDGECEDDPPMSFVTDSIKGMEEGMEERFDKDKGFGRDECDSTNSSRSTSWHYDVEK